MKGNSSKKYVEFLSSGYYFPSYISPLIFDICDLKLTKGSLDVSTSWM